MKAIFGDVSAEFNEDTRWWDSDYEPLRDALNSRLEKERCNSKEHNYSITYAMFVARKQMPTLEFIEDKQCLT